VAVGYGHTPSTLRLLYYLLMERMIRRIAIRKDWTISMSEFRNFAEKYQWEIDKLEEENKKLREEIEIFYKPRVEELEKDLEHSDSFFSIMRDVLKNNEISNKELVCILCCVVHELCWDYDLSSKELEIVKKFWNRKYV
jgi:predicted nuclease with TOPRIM domain